MANKAKFSYTYKLTKEDMWKFYMLMKYSSLSGVVQVIFTLAMFILLFSKGIHSNSIFLAINIFGCLIFPFFQPVAIYGQTIKSFDERKPGNTISFDDTCMQVQVGLHVQVFNYEDILASYNRPGMILIQPDDKHVYILPSRVLGEDKKALASFLKEKIRDEE